MRAFFLLLSLYSSMLLATPAQVIIIRHGEKPEKGHDLSPQGEARAAALVSFFQTDPRMLSFGLPAAIFASQPNSEDPSRREIDTITPLAEALGLPLLTPYASTEGPKLAKYIETEAAYNGKMILISWEHSVMNILSSAFGVEPIPAPYPGDRFDLIYMLTYEERAAGPTFCIELQNLMPDDNPTPPSGFPVCSY